MTSRRDLDKHRQSLSEIRNIMNSMKTLAYMETRKLARFLKSQQQVISNIEVIATDFLGHYPEIMPESEEQTSIVIVIGTERGFCGDFNNALKQHMEDFALYSREKEPQFICVGRKLYSGIEGDPRITACIDGASVTEEIGSVFNQLVNTISSLQKKEGIFNLYSIYHEENGVMIQEILPPFQDCLNIKPCYSYAPLLNLPEEQFFSELTDHYLFAVLNEILYTSLMAENFQRVSHLEVAVRHLDEKTEELNHKYNAVRQEEIIEEIEVILLSAASLAEFPEKRKN